MNNEAAKIQDIESFRLPEGFRGRPGWYVQLWWLVQSTLFQHSPQLLNGFRARLLRLFGAKVGMNTVVRPSVTVTYPWKIVIGDNVWIGADVVLYSLDRIAIGDDSVISQRSYLCAADHDYADSSFAIRGGPIVIGNQCWLAADTFVGPNVIIEDECVVGARSSVFKNLPKGMICMGTPAVPVRRRRA